jgi:hypothetical protein
MILNKHMTLFQGDVLVGATSPYDFPLAFVELRGMEHLRMFAQHTGESCSFPVRRSVRQGDP